MNRAKIGRFFPLALIGGALAWLITREKGEARAEPIPGYFPFPTPAPTTPAGEGMYWSWQGETEGWVALTQPTYPEGKVLLIWPNGGWAMVWDHDEQAALSQGARRPNTGEVVLGPTVMWDPSLPPPEPYAVPIVR